MQSDYAAWSSPNGQPVQDSFATGRMMHAEHIVHKSMVTTQAGRYSLGGRSGYG